MSKIIKQKERGSLIVMSGPSGCGKGTVIQEFLKKHKDAWLSISCTSRDPRHGDVPNETYYFITREEFENVINRLKNYLIASTNENTVSAAADAPIATKPEKIERSFEF